MNKILVIGSLNADLVVRSPRFPSPGETIQGENLVTIPGGKGANQAVAAARLGGNVTFITKTGCDMFGAEAIHLFETEGIDGRFIIKDVDNPSGVALINVDENGENCIVVAPGSNGTLSDNDINDEVFENTPEDIFLMQLEIPVETVEFVAEKAAKKGNRVILNPAPALPLSDNLLALIYLITPNETEAELLTGIKVTDLSSAEKAASILQHKGARNVVITMGGTGAYIKSGQISKIVPVAPVKPVDTTAAGDVFNGALSVAISEGKNMEDAVIFANRAASISVTRMGAQASAPYRGEIV